MPYERTLDLPANVQNVLPPHAQEIYVAAFNNATQEYGNEATARKVAWAAVKEKYRKTAQRRWIERS